MIAEDFKDHLKLAHRVFLSENSLLDTFLNHNAVPFVSLHFCDKCQIRASDLRVMIQHRNTCVGLVKCQTEDYTLNHKNLVEFYKKYWSRIGPNQPRDAGAPSSTAANVVNTVANPAAPPRAITAPTPRLPTMSISPMAAKYLASTSETYAPKRTKPRFPLSLPIAKSTPMVMELDQSATEAAEANQVVARVVADNVDDPDVIVEEEDDESEMADETTQEYELDADTDVSDAETIIYRQTETTTVISELKQEGRAPKSPTATATFTTTKKRTTSLSTSVPLSTSTAPTEIFKRECLNLTHEADAIADLLPWDRDAVMTRQRLYFSKVPMPGVYAAKQTGGPTRRFTVRPFPMNPYASMWSNCMFPTDLDDDKFVAYIWTPTTRPPNMVGYATVRDYLPNAVMELTNNEGGEPIKMTVNATWCYK